MSEIIPTAVSNRICNHMNKDHGEAVLVYAQHYGDCDTAKSATMLSLDENGMNLEVVLPTGQQTLFIPFPRPLNNAKDAHTVLVEMMQEAKGNLP